MFRVDTPSAQLTDPGQDPAGTPGFFYKGDPVQGVPATTPGADWFNTVQEELISILTHAGVAPDKPTRNQVITALISLGLRAATTSLAGVSREATSAEVLAGLISGAFVTPATLQAKINALLDAAPGSLDTLNELAAALGDDPNFAATMTAALAAKAPLASPALTGTPTGPTAAAGTNTLQLATTAFVQAALAALTGLTQPGEVAFFAMSTAPTGWLKCNGAAISRTTYSALYAKIGTTYGAGDGSTTFNLPDLRGEFLRAWDDGRGVDSGRAFGSSQLDAFQNFTGSLRASAFAGATSYVYATGVFSAGSYFNSAFSGGGGGANTGAIYTLNPSASARTSTETRPRNTAQLACIKY